MRQIMDGVFARYGMDGVITTASGSRSIKVFFHSVNSRSWQNMERMFSALGEVPRGQYVGIFPAETAVATGDGLTVNGKNYTVSRVEPMCDRTGPVYQWSLCVEKGGGEEWPVSE